MSFASYSSSGGVSSVSLEDSPGVLGGAAGGNSSKSPSLSLVCSPSPSSHSPGGNIPLSVKSKSLLQQQGSKTSVQLHSSSLGLGGVRGFPAGNGRSHTDLLLQGGGCNLFRQDSPTSSSALTRRRRSFGGLPSSKSFLLSPSPVVSSQQTPHSPEEDMRKTSNRCAANLIDKNSSSMARRASDSCVVRTWGFDDSLQSGRERNSKQQVRHPPTPSLPYTDEKNSKRSSKNVSLTSSRKSSASIQGSERTSYPAAPTPQ
ncbi:hypothetical protein CSUI_003903 [Cystoisospora suis]|uniref:Uncharacterized protein n=1 Tax=Cystoisospora suis TaxID=483139 RepID=A0A2C6L0P1_9APIC|nr:hypothetical protein CSUI_003903 [Cystoisospora suis]